MRYWLLLGSSALPNSLHQSWAEEREKGRGEETTEPLPLVGFCGGRGFRDRQAVLLQSASFLQKEHSGRIGER